jgi:hypothetical protein
MNENQSGTGNLLDTTDCLEAVGIFKGWKNFFFVILFLCILLSQGSFWLLDTGLVSVPPKISGNNSITIPITIDSNSAPSDNKNKQLIPEQKKIEEPVKEAAEPNLVSFSTAERPVILASATTIPLPNNQSATESSKTEFLFGVTFKQISWLMRFVNVILILTAFLYCLTMLFCLKISMLGRLGGINHITRAFFLSLIMLILVLPWQSVFDSTIIGAVFTLDEFIKWQARKTGDMLNMILYYMRFCGYIVLVFLFLVLAQIRSCRWAKAILKRLEII